MSKVSCAAGLAALAFLAACATATPYQAATQNSRGYAEQKIEANRFQVEFSGNSLTDRKTVETYLLYRAAELTRENGFDHFRVADRETQGKTTYVPVGPAYPAYAHYSPYYTHFNCAYRFYGPHAAYYYNRYRDPFTLPAVTDPRFGYYDPFWGGPAEYREVTRYDASAEILMGKGAKPDDAAYFDAAEVMRNLGPSIKRPEA
jgi:hypothetical protein